MNLEGKIIGNRYEVIEKVGNGGMAMVYKARDTILNRYVAIKVLRDEFTTDEEFIKRFNTEAQSAARLTHPNIVSVFDVGQEYNIYYIVMELVQGKTLKQIVSEEGALPWKWTVNIAIQICSALEMAHRNGIVHRDIKPHNIIITEDGIAKVTDFGIAKAVSNSTITAFGTTIGSVHYFSPEHARGGFTDAKSDLYSLGVVMYEMVTGRVPFDADTPVSVALKHMQEEPVEPIKLNAQIPMAVNKIILKAMKKDANLRYGSATEMMKDLSMALKNPTGEFVSEKSNEDYTRVIPTVKGEETSRATRGQNETRRREQSQKTGLAKYLEENPEKKPLIYAGIAILIIAFIAVVFWGSMKLTTTLLGGNSGNSSENVTIENYSNIPIDEAKSKLDQLGVKYEISEEYSDTVASGAVISQSVNSGTKYDPTKQSPIKLVVSKGIKVVSMPKVKGLTYKEAVEKLKELELQAEKVEETSQTVEEGIVIEQETEENSKVNVGTKVKLHVSIGTGLQKMVVPSVVDLDVEEAKKNLTAQKLEVNIVYSEDTSKSNGVVLKQSIEVGEVVEEGSSITITVNKIQELKEGTININVKSLTGYTEPKKETTEEGEEKATKAQEVKNVVVRVNVDNEDVYKKSVPENTENVNVTIKGKGVVNIKVYIDEVRYANEQMDLNSDNRILEIKK